MNKSSGKKKYARLAEVIGYTFTDCELLDRALTHSSYKGSCDTKTADSGFGGDYERLEFLGDRVLGLVISDELVHKFTDANEGELARRLNYLVRKEMCAEVADEMGLLQFVRLGNYEDDLIARMRVSVGADVCEAIIGAVYCDGGFKAAQALISRFWSDRICRAEAYHIDAKTRVQELLQGKGINPPCYEITNRTGPDHAPVIEITMKVDGFADVMARGSSRRRAEQLAAENFLNNLDDKSDKAKKNNYDKNYT